MKRRIKALDVALILAVLITGAIFYFKYIKTSQPDSSFKISKSETLSVSDLTGNKLEWQSLLSNNEDNWFLILEMSNCNTCIYKGLDDIKALKKEGKPCFVIVVHDIVDEVSGWSGTVDFSPFYMMTRSDFYEHISSMVLPAIVKINGNQILKYRYITL